MQLEDHLHDTEIDILYFQKLRLIRKKLELYYEILSPQAAHENVVCGI